MALEKPPCKGCADRYTDHTNHTNCHSECKRYAEYTERIKAAREAEAQYRRESWDFTVVRKKQVYKIGERMGKKKP